MECFVFSRFRGNKVFRVFVACFVRATRIEKRYRILGIE
jgi:hypothetical protein